MSSDERPLARAGILRRVPLTSPHAQPAPKSLALDQDRQIVLTSDVAERFAAMLNEQFTSRATRAFFDAGEAAQLATAITESREFPFIAHAEERKILVTPALDKMSAPVLKDISDGATAVQLAFIKKVGLGEQAKYQLAQLFLPAIQAAYTAAGMPEGSHTKYVTRGC